jgi:protein O-mannosyl-transferase
MSSLKPRIQILIIAFVAILIYSNTISSPFEFDDRRAIIDNPVIRNFDFFVDPAALDINSIEKRKVDFPKTRYVGYLSFAVNYHLHGLDVTGYHIINILIHIINGLLVYWLVLLIVRTPFFLENFGSGFNGSIIAFFSSLLFVCHPVQTQAVTYIVQRLASLATMFYLIAVALYIKSRLSASGSARHCFYAISLIAAIAAMFTKEISFTLPIVILMCEIFFFRWNNKTSFFHLIPFILLLPIIPLILMWNFDPAASHGGIDNALNIANTRGLSGTDYLLTQFRVIITYIRLLFFPVEQNLDYDYPLYSSVLSYPVIFSFSGLCLISAMGIYLYLRSRYLSEISAYFRLISFGVFWFFLALSVESSVIPISDVIFEHRLYLPSIGFFIAFAASILAIRHKAAPRLRHAGEVITSFMIISILILSFAAYQRNNVWQTAISLWEDTAGKSPLKFRPHYQLGIAYLDANRIKDAIRELNIVLQTEDFTELHYNLGVALFKAGLYNEAIASYKRALFREPSDFNSRHNLAVTYLMVGQHNDAETEFKAAIQLQPEDIDAHTNMAILYENLGNITEAVKEYRFVMKRQPLIPDKISNLGVLFFNKGDFHAAIKKYQLALKLNPDLVQAHYNLALAYRKVNKPDMAIAEFRTALILTPDLAIAHFNLALIYKERKQFSLAIKELKAALEIQPDYTEAQKELALIQ